MISCNRRRTPNTPDLPSTAVQNPKSLTLLHLRISRLVTKLQGEETQISRARSPQTYSTSSAQAKQGRSLSPLRWGRGDGVPRRIPAQLTPMHSSLLTLHQVSIKSTVRHVIQLFSKITDEH